MKIKLREPYGGYTINQVVDVKTPDAHQLIAEHKAVRAVSARKARSSADTGNVAPEETAE